MSLVHRTTLGAVVAASGLAVLVAPWPMVRVVAGLLLLTILPGWGLLRALGRDMAPTAVEAVPMAFALGLLTIAPAACLAYFLLVRLDVAAAMLLAAALIAMVAGTAIPRPASSPVAPAALRRARLILTVLIAAAAAFAYRHAGVPYTDRLADVWFHLSFVRKLHGLAVADPSNPFLVGEGVEFVYGYNVWHLVVAVVARWANVDPIEAWAMTVPVVAFVLLAAIVPLADALFGPRVAVVTGVLYVVIHTITKDMSSLVSAPKPGSIAVWIFPLLTLALIVRYVRTGRRRDLVVGALLNAVPAGIHFVEPVGVLIALAIAAATGALFVEDRRHVRRLMASVAVVAVPFAIVFAAKAGLLAGQAERYSTYAAQHPIRLPGGFVMNDPYNSALRDPFVLAALVLMPWLFGALRTHLGVHMVVWIPLVYLAIQHHPLLATGTAWIAGETFVRKVISFLNQLAVITVAAVLVERGPGVAARITAWWRARRATQAPAAWVPIVIAAIAASGLAVYALYAGPALGELGRTRLDVPDRHALKALLAGAAGMVVFSAVLVALAVTLVRTSGAASPAWAACETAAPTLRPVTLAAALGVVVLVAAAPGVERRLAGPDGAPRTIAARALELPALAFLRTEASAPVVVLVKPRDGAFDQQTPALFLQAFTTHYAASLPDPDFKRTRSSVDYQQRFRDVKHLYGETATLDDVRRVAARYDVSYVVASRADTSRALFERLSGAPSAFPPAWQGGDVAVFRVADAGKRTP
jgi:hypothetical protein